MADSGPVVLMIEDELPIRRFVRTTLTSQEFAFVEAATGAEGVSLAGSHKPEIVLLDLGLPDMDGLEVIRKLREWTSVPVIVISARGKEKDKVAALDAGADDYLTKPFGAGELTARIRVALRHARRVAQEGPDEPVFTCGKLRVDLAKRQVFIGERELHLTPIEYKVLSVLVRHAGKVVTQRQLLVEVWGQAHDEQTHYLRIYVHQLRQKLEANPVRPRYLITEAGVGYRLKDEE
jgi:two-component system KDP operon response regulator KdpE